jgi:eukaryotic-like serine/threonine-protein kinase
MSGDGDDDPGLRRVAPRAGGGFEHDRRRAEVRARLFGDAPPAATIGPYEISEVIGEGGMGVVYRARAPGSEREVAVKVMRVPSALVRARLQREARALQALSHPHVVRVEASGETNDGGFFIVMEHVQGPTLRQWLAAAPRRPAVLERFVELADALAAAHRLGLIHRDVKPDNVRMTLEGHAKLLDFGLAKALLGTEAADLTHLGERLTATGAWLGTPGYAAPEQLLGRDVDARADQFALCVSLYEALWGRLPFTGKTADAVGVAAVAGRIQSPPEGDGVPPAVRAAVLRGLMPKPADRFSDLGQLRAILQEAAGSR